jgi:DNA-binding transcriptional MerR regulator
MKSKIYSTKEVADLCGVHPNTVRLYEKWGYLSQAERGWNNYRRFTEEHLLQMRLARLALPGPYPIDYNIVQGLVKRFAAGDWTGSMEMAEKYLVKVEAELEKAVKAMEVLDRWFENKPGSKDIIVSETRKKAGEVLGLTIDTLRTWERNGLYSISKNVQGKVRFSEWDMEKIMVISLLRKSGYSIASLLNVFGNEENLAEKPSKLLSLKANESEIGYFTDRYIEYLEGHLERAQKIIDLLKKFKKMEKDRDV